MTKQKKVSKPGKATKAAGGKSPKSDDFKKVMQVITSHIYEKHKLCDGKWIRKKTGLSDPRVRDVIKILAGQKQLYEIYSGGEGKPNLYIPYRMMHDILMLQARPEWVTGYEFPEKKGRIGEIQEKREEIHEYEMLERLLYCTDIPLQEAVAFALSDLGFEGVVHHAEIDDSHDVEFQYEGRLRLIEVKGKGEAADKGDVQQLSGWVDKKLDEGMKSEEVDGLLAINHYRYDDPSMRKDPVTAKGKEFLKARQFRYFTGVFLFDLVREVRKQQITRDEAQKRLVAGEPM